MKVTSIRVYTPPCGNRRPIIAEVSTDSGVAGVGEAGIAYGVGTSAAAAMVLEIGERFVLGQDAEGIERIWNDAYDMAFWSKAGGPVFYAALSAVEHALWDIRGKSLGVPVYELIGGKLWEQIPVYANGWWIGCESSEDFAKAAIATVEDGYPALKLYPFGVADDLTVVRHPQRRRIDRELEAAAVERVRAIREAVGDDVEILLDFGGGLSTAQTISICRRLEEFDIGFVEEPVDPFSEGALEVLAAKTAIPIAVGERIYTRYGFHRVLTSGAVQVLQPDVCNTGGIFEAKKIAAMAEIFNVTVSPHNYGSPLATTISVQLAATLPNFTIQEFFPYFRDEPGYLELFDGNIEATVSGGFLPLPTEPGLGVALRHDVVAPYLSGEVTA
jgi:galactonate dehydratase